MVAKARYRRSAPTALVTGGHRSGIAATRQHQYPRAFGLRDLFGGGPLERLLLAAHRCDWKPRSVHPATGAARVQGRWGRIVFWPDDGHGHGYRHAAHCRFPAGSAPLYRGDNAVWNEIGWDFSHPTRRPCGLITGVCQSPNRQPQQLE